MRTVIFVGLIKIAEAIYLTAKTDGKFLGEIEVKLNASISPRNFPSVLAVR